MPELPGDFLGPLAARDGFAGGRLAEAMEARKHAARNLNPAAVGVVLMEDRERRPSPRIGCPLLRPAERRADVAVLERPTRTRPTDPGQDPSHVGTIEPVWNVFDFIPEGSGTDWDEQLSYA